MKELTIGVLGFQGAIEEHIASVKQNLRERNLAGKVIWVKSIKDIEAVDGFIIPGGESTVIGETLSFKQMLQPINDRIYDGMPIFGTCAGLIVLAKKSYDKVIGKKDQPTIGIMDVVVERNYFGRQRESFEADLEIPILGKKKFKGVFIRAPSIIEAGHKVNVLCKLNDIIVAVQDGNMIGTSFHPELADDIRFHNYFLDMIINNQLK